MIKNFVKIFELLGDRLEVCVSVLCTIGLKPLSIKFCYLSFSLNLYRFSLIMYSVELKAHLNVLSSGLLDHVVE